MTHDARVRELVDDFRRGYLTRRGFLAKGAALGLTAAAAGFFGAAGSRAVAQDAPEVEPKQWRQGEGWGWV